MTRSGVKFKRMTAFVLAMICLLACLGGPAYAAEADTESEGGNYSYYKMSSVASAFFADSMARGGDKLANLNKITEGGDVGAFLGYSDEADQSGIIQGWIMAALSSSSATFSYSSFKTDDDDAGTDAVSKALYSYVNYGRALHSVGFDQTGTSSSFNLRFLSGLLMKGVYYMSQSVEWLFSNIVKAMQVFNPFRFIDPGDDYHIAGVEYAYTSSGSDMREEDGDGVKELGKFLSEMYATIQEYGAVVMITIFFAILVISLVLGNDKNAPHKVLVFVRRLLIVCLGVPIIGSFYTTMLNALGTDLTMGGSQIGTSRVLLSTFLDFETWARETQLTIPSAGTRLVYDAGSNTVSHQTVTGLRDTCYRINANSWTSAGKWKTSMGNALTTTSGYTNGEAALNKFNAEATKEVNLSKDDVATLTGELNGLLDRYMNGTFYYASDWATDKRVDTSADYVRVATGTVSEFSSNFDSIFTEGNIWTNGGQLGRVREDAENGKTAVSGTGIYTYDVSNHGLSDMSMYNYLTSKFENSSVVVFSSEKASSGFVRESHYSVNLIGTNALEAGLYYFDALTLLLSSALIGWFYGVSLLLSSIRRSITVIMDIPFVALGSLKSAARVLLQVTMTLIEILGTVMAYVVVTEIMMSLSDIMMPLWTDAASGWDPSSTSTVLTAFGMTAVSPFSGSTVTAPLAASSIQSVIHLIILAINIVVKVAFLVMAMKLRKSIIKSLDEQAKGIIDKLFGVDAGPTGNEGPGLGSRLAAAGAAGAGAALGHKLMGGGSSDGKVKGTAKAESGKDSGGGTGGGEQSGGTDEASDSEFHDTQAGEAVEGGEQSALPSGGGDEGADFNDGNDSDHVDESTRQSIDEADSLDSVNVDGGGGTIDSGAPEAGDESSHEAEADGDADRGASGDESGDESGDDNEPGGVNAADGGEANGSDGDVPDGLEAAETSAIAAGAAAGNEASDGENSGSDRPDGPKAGEPAGSDKQADGEGRGAQAGDEAGSGSGGDAPEAGKGDMDSGAERPAEAGDAAGSGERDGSESGSGDVSSKSGDASGKSGHDSGTGGPGDASKSGGGSPKAAKPGDAKTDGGGKPGDKSGKPGAQGDGEASTGQGSGRPGEGGSVKSAQAGDGQSGKGEAEGSGAKASGNGKPGESGGTGPKAGSSGGTAKPVAGADDKSGVSGKSGGKSAGNPSGAGQSGGSKPADSADVSQAQTRRAAAEAAYAEALAAAGGSESGIESGGNEPSDSGVGAATKNPAADGGFESGGNTVQDGVTAGAKGPDAADGTENARGGSDDAKPGRSEQPGKDDGVRGVQATPNGKGPQGQGDAAGRSAPVEGTINGQSAHGTITRNADGSATVSMRKDGQGPSAEVPIAGVEQVNGAGVSNGTGQPDGGRKSSAGKAAVAAAVASFMASSDNQVIAAAGQGLGQAANAQMAAEAYRRNDSGGSQASDQGTAHTSGPQGQKGATQSQGQKGAAQSQGQKGTTQPRGKGGRAPTQQSGGGITNGANQNAGRPAPRHAADITTQAELDAFNQETAELEAKTQALLERQKKDGTRKQRPSGGKAPDKAGGQARPDGEVDAKREKGEPGKKQPLKPKKLKKDK